MRKIASLLAVFSTLLVASFGCSDEKGSTVSNQPNVSGRTSTGGGSGGSGGNPLSPVAGASSESAGRGGSLGIPTDACMGLPIDVSEDPVAGAPSTSGGAPAGGAPVEEEDPAAAGAAGASAQACQGVSLEAEAVPVDLFIIMDRSQSMGFTVEGSTTTRWEALRDAVESFALEPAAAEIRAGIGFFSISGVGDDSADCDAASYAEPVVPIGVLPDVASELVAAMDDTIPAGLTPTVPALEGAISYAQSWATDNPDRATLVVLVSDGYPTQCETGPEGVSAAAQAGYESDQHIRTFVIGVGDVARFNLDNYARAGGTTRAFVTDAGDVTQSFVEALSNISDRDLACEYQVPTPPAGMKLDTSKVQVVYTPASGSAEEVPNIPSLAACADTSNGGWYYDDPVSPSKITVCPCTCARFQAGRVDVRLGCKPRLGIR